LCWWLQTNKRRKCESRVCDGKEVVAVVRFDKVLVLVAAGTAQQHNNSAAQ
jgi:hypothetical protein